MWASKEAYKEEEPSKKPKNLVKVNFPMGKFQFDESHWSIGRVSWQDLDYRSVEHCTDKLVRKLEFRKFCGKEWMELPMRETLWQEVESGKNCESIDDEANDIWAIGSGENPSQRRNPQKVVASSNYQAVMQSDISLTVGYGGPTIIKFIEIFMFDISRGHGEWVFHNGGSPSWWRPLIYLCVNPTRFES